MKSVKQLIVGLGVSTLIYTGLAEASSNKLSEGSFIQSAVVLNSKSQIEPKKALQQSSGTIIQRRQVEKVVRDKKTLNKKPQVLRPEQIENSKNSSAFEIYDSWVTLYSDSDGDGYYSEFDVNFDADFSGGYADVYAEIYLSLEGGSWIHINTTDVFSIYSSSDNDSYKVSIGLNFDFPTGEYDLLIDLYEAGYPGVVATAGPANDGDLYALPLEDKRHELNSDNTLITYVASTLNSDGDLDGYFTGLTLEYDIDTYDSGRLVYAEIDLTNSVTFQQHRQTTVNFQLGNQTELVDLDFVSGYNSGLYDIEIRLIDVDTGEILANAAQNFSSLTQLPIESEDFDYSNSSGGGSQGHVDHTHAVDAHGSGGGSLGLFSGLLLVLVTLLSKSKNNRLFSR